MISSKYYLYNKQIAHQILPIRNVHRSQYINLIGLHLVGYVICHTQVLLGFSKFVLLSKAPYTPSPNPHFLCMLHMETISCAIWAWLWWKMFDVYQDVCCDVISRPYNRGSIIWDRGRWDRGRLCYKLNQMMVQKTLQTSNEFILKVCWSQDMFMAFRIDTQCNVQSFAPTHYHKSVHVSKHFQCSCLMFFK